MTDTLAEVHTLHPFPTPPSPYARELAFRLYETRPIDTDVTAQTAYRIEDQLADLWDRQLDPAWALETFAPEIGTLRAGDLLDDLFDAADAAAHAEMVQSGTEPTRQAYADALHALGAAVREASAR